MERFISFCTPLTAFDVEIRHKILYIGINLKYRFNELVRFFIKLCKRPFMMARLELNLTISSERAISFLYE